MDMPDRDRDVAHANGGPVEPPAKPPAERRTAPRRWILRMVVGVLLVVCLIPVAFTATPRQCATCHEMRPYYDTWRTSSHRAAVPNCLTCHVDPGIFNLVGFEFGFYRMLAGHFAGAQVKTTAANTPSVASCTREGCHSLNREVSNSGDLKINHRLHVVSAHIACPRCHPGAVHAGVGGRLKLPPMKLCKQCHADKMTDCTFCHTEEHLPAAPGVH